MGREHDSDDYLMVFMGKASQERLRAGDRITRGNFSSSDCTPQEQTWRPGRLAPQLVGELRHKTGREGSPFEYGTVSWGEVMLFCYPFPVQSTYSPSQTGGRRVEGDTHLRAYLGVHGPVEDLPVTDPDDGRCWFGVVGVTGQIEGVPSPEAHHRPSADDGVLRRNWQGQRGVTGQPQHHHVDAHQQDQDQ